MSVFIPSVIYVVAIYFIGIYVASTIFIGAFMYWHGRFPWIKIIPVSLIVPVSMFLLFELWFMVPLAQGSAGGADRLLTARPSVATGVITFFTTYSGVRGDK